MHQYGILKSYLIRNSFLNIIYVTISYVLLSPHLPFLRYPASHNNEKKIKKIRRATPVLCRAASVMSIFFST